MFFESRPTNKFWSKRHALALGSSWRIGKHLNRRRVNESRLKKRASNKTMVVPEASLKQKLPALQPALQASLQTKPEILADWDFGNKHAIVVHEGQNLITKDVRPLEAIKSLSRVMADFEFQSTILSLPIASVWWALVNGDGSSSSAAPCFRSMVPIVLKHCF